MYFAVALTTSGNTTTRLSPLVPCPVLCVPKCHTSQPLVLHLYYEVSLRTTPNNTHYNTNQDLTLQHQVSQPTNPNTTPYNTSVAPYKTKCYTIQHPVLIHTAVTRRTIPSAPDVWSMNCRPKYSFSISSRCSKTFCSST